MTWLARLYIWATYRLYDELAWAYDPVSWLVSLGRWSGWRRMALDYVAGGRILEVGFGTGELLVEMARRDLRAVGLDASPPMQRIAARKLARRGLAMPRLQAVTQAMPFADRAFDAIVATFPAGYILDPATLREVARLLRPPDPATGRGGGRLVVVGLVVRFDSRLVQQAARFLFGAPAMDLLERFEEAITAAGLQATVVERRSKAVRVPVVIAERGAVIGEGKGGRDENPIPFAHCTA